MNHLKPLSKDPEGFESAWVELFVCELAVVDVVAGPWYEAVWIDTCRNVSGYCE